MVAGIVFNGAKLGIQVLSTLFFVICFVIRSLILFSFGLVLSVAVQYSIYWSQSPLEVIVPLPEEPATGLHENYFVEVKVHKYYKSNKLRMTCSLNLKLLHE